jgi:uncharacterized Rossmann fold enzyme
MGYRERDDYLSASILNSMLREDSTEELIDILKERIVAVVGAGPSLSEIRGFQEERIVAADGASRYLREIGIEPHVIVTDLDGIERADRAFYVVHAHGDNQQLLWKVEEMKKVVGTCQVSPFGRLRVFGGFTDGDRALALALYAGARKVNLYGMDFDSEFVGKYSKPGLTDHIPASAAKRAKLAIGKRITEHLLGT